MQTSLFGEPAAGMVNPIVFARAVTVQPVGMDLFEGFTRLRVLTYSASVPMIVKLLHRFETVECVFGYERVARSLNDIWAFQKVVAEELATTIHGLEDETRQALFAKLAAGEVRFSLLREGRSHAKIYLLDGPGRRRVIVGSSNASLQAWADTPTAVGRLQVEGNIAFDDDDLAWETFERMYRDVRDRSTSELRDIPLQRGQLGELAFEEIPVNREADRGNVVVAVANEALPVVVQPRVERLSRTYEAIASEVKRVKNSFTLRPREIGVLARLLRSKRSEEGDPVQWLSIHAATGTVSLNEQPIALAVEPEAVRQDAALLVRYFESFTRGFVGPVAQQQRLYFAFMAWFYLSPLMCDLLNHAKLHNGFIYSYPMFAVLYGKSNCGKSRLLETLMISMLGKHKVRTSADLTAQQVRGLQVESRRFPVVFEDIEKDRIKNAYGLIKATTDTPISEAELAPFVFAMNADEGHAFPDEVRKRAIVIYTGANLPRGSEFEAENFTAVREIQGQLGTSFYRAYLSRLLPRLPEARETDFLWLSSSILCDLIAEATGDPLPAWCAPIRYRELQSLQDEKTRGVLLKLWEVNPKAWTIRGDTVILRLEPHEVHGLKKDLPDMVINEGASKGGNIVLHREQLEMFLDRRLTRSWRTRLGW